MAKLKKDLQHELKEQLRYETLLTDISVHFVKFPANQIDAAIEDAQRRTCELLGLDRSILWQMIERESGRMLLSHIYQSLECLLPDSPCDASDSFPWILNRVMQGNIVTITSLATLPPEADRDRESLKTFGTKSVIVMPLSVGGKVVGALSFGRLREEEAWQEKVINRLQLIAQIFANALARKQSEEALETRLQFETLLTEISSRFINLPADRVDFEIEDAQGLICERLGLDLSALWQWSDETPPFFILTHLHAAPEGPFRPERLDAQESFPWTLQGLIAGELRAFNTEELPPEAARDQEAYRFYGIKSSVAIPLSVGGGALIGALSFNGLQSERFWPDSMLNNLQTVAQIFANALARKFTEIELRESEARLNMATTAAGVGLWVMEIDSGQVWVTPNTRALFQFAADEMLNIDSFFKAVHARDRDRVHHAVDATTQTGENLKIEYRVILSDGSVRWIYASGQRFLGLSGKPLRLMGVSTDINERKQMEEQLRMRLEEIEVLKQKIEKENIYLREEIELQNVHGEIIGRSQAMMQILAQVEQVARTDTTVLIEGETGTGKELLARAVHQLSARKDRPLVTVNCASLPPTLIESELFGREKGAYTGAMTRMTGRFELADRATLFLDEIGELPLDVQAKLLRVLEQGRFERLGSTRSLEVDVRIIAASNRNLEREATAGRFRKDLFFRLNVFPIVLPPLRERPEDIPALVWSFVREFEKKIGRRVDNISRKCMDDLQRYAWPGNIRELKNVIERAMIVSSGRTLEICSPKGTFAENSAVLNLEENERRLIQSVLQQTGWRLSGPGGAAGILGLKRTTLQSKMRKLGIRRSPQ